MFSVDAEKGEMWIYDEIGPSYWGLIDASAVVQGLKEIGDKNPVAVHLNTPGGSVDEGIAIYTALRKHRGDVTIVVDSLAASMGSYIMQAGDRRLISSNGAVMIHDPWTIAAGNATDLRKAAEVLDKYAARMIPDYAAASGKTEDEILDIMAAETWYTAAEAVGAGFADAIDGETDEQPRISQSLMRCSVNMPPAMRDAIKKIKQSGPDERKPEPFPNKRSVLAKIAASRQASP